MPILSKMSVIPVTPWKACDASGPPCVGVSPKPSPPAFRPIHGRLYAVPPALSGALAAALRDPLRTALPAILASPGVVWRHDPYSAARLQPSPSARPRPAATSRYQTSKQTPQITENPESPEIMESPALLGVLRALPPLFADVPRPAPGGGRRAARFVFIVSHRCRRTACAAPVAYAANETVVLEGDMGIEMGRVRAVMAMADFDALSARERTRRGFPADRDAVTAAFVLRRATPGEERHADVLRALEADLLDFLQHRLHARSFHQCRVQYMEFLDCEFQADCMKIYVYYRATHHVLFRELAQYLYSLYHCRIWLHEVGRGSPTVSTDTSQSVEEGARRGAGWEFIEEK